MKSWLSGLSLLSVLSLALGCQGELDGAQAYGSSGWEYHHQVEICPVFYRDGVRVEGESFKVQADFRDYVEEPYDVQITGLLESTDLDTLRSVRRAEYEDDITDTCWTVVRGEGRSLDHSFIEYFIEERSPISMIHQGESILPSDIQVTRTHYVNDWDNLIDEQADTLIVEFRF